MASNRNKRIVVSGGGLFLTLYFSLGSLYRKRINENNDCFSCLCGHNALLF